MKRLMFFVCGIIVFNAAKAQVYLAENGLTVSGDSTNKKVLLGGTLNNAQTSIDFGIGNFSSSFLIKKSTANYFFITNSGSIGFGTDAPHASAVLDISSATQGFLPPRMTAAQRLGISSPAASLFVWDTDSLMYMGYNGTSWKGLRWTNEGAGNGWGLSGNTGTTAGTNFIGTADNTDLVIKTNAIENARLRATGGMVFKNAAGLDKIDLNKDGTGYLNITHRFGQGEGNYFATPLAITALMDSAAKKGRGSLISAHRDYKIADNMGATTFSIDGGTITGLLSVASKKGAYNIFSSHHYPTAAIHGSVRIGTANNDSIAQFTLNGSNGFKAISGVSAFYAGNNFLQSGHWSANIYGMVNGYLSHAVFSGKASRYLEWYNHFAVGETRNGTTGGTGSGSGKIGTVTGLLIENIKSDSIARAWGVLQLGTNDWNSFRGNLMIGDSAQGNAGTSRLFVDGGVRLKNLPSGLGTKALRIDSNGDLFVADTTTGSSPGSSLWTDAGSGNIYNTTLNGKIGIGTASPTVKLSLADTGPANGIVIGEGLANPVNLYRYSPDVLGTDDNFRVGGVLYANGIQSVNSALDFGGSVVQNIRAINFYNLASARFNPDLNEGGEDQGILIYPTNNLYNEPLLNIQDATRTSTTFAVRSNGKVGIGTLTPVYKLDVAGNARFNNSLFVNEDGTIAMGAVTSFPSGYKLAVAGNIIAEKIRIKLQSGWPDYVFSSNYKLPSLQEVEKFIQEHKHLPGMPSAREVEQNGLDLGDGQAMLLKKIEELTLHVIEMNKKVIEMNNKAIVMEDKINKLTIDNEGLKREIEKSNGIKNR